MDTRARRFLLASVVALALVAAPAAHAAVAASFIPLGVDPAGDSATPDGEAPKGTLKVVDIVSAGIATVGTELQFKLGLVANSEAAGSYCWAMGFQKGTTEMFPVICAEFAGGTLVGQVGWTTQVSSSRGTQIPSTTGEFVTGGIVMHIPLADAGLKVGDKIDDIYGLTYVSRALNTADTIPDAKSDKAAATSLGSYVIGATTAGTSTDGAAKTVYETLDATSLNLTRSFANATTGVVHYNWTAGPANATLSLSVHGSGNVTVVVKDAANATLLSVTPRNEVVSKALAGKAGTWTITFNVTAFKGNFTLQAGPRAPAASGSGGTGTTTGSASASQTGSATPTTSGGSSSTKGTPGIPAGILLVALVGLAVARRRR